MRVLLGPENPAGVAAALRDGLRARGHEADVVTFAAHPFGYAHDRLADSPVARIREGLGVRRYDVAHWQFGTTLLEYLDARLARVTARRTLQLMHYWGDDARTELIARRIGSPRAAILPLQSAQRDEPTVIKRLEKAAKLCRAALVSDLELAAFVEPFFERIYLVPTPLGALPGVPHAAPHDGPPVVFHAPSDRATKGTAEITAVLDRLAGENLCTPRMVTGVPREQVIAEVAAADVVVDQLNTETSGVFALEAMAVGRPVLLQFRRERLAPFAQDTPLVAVTADTLEAELRALLADPARREQLGDAGRRFVRRTHDPVAVAAALEHLYAHAPSAAPGTYVATTQGVSLRAA